MKWYISGKISGLPTDQVTAKFKQAEQQIRAFGHEPVNPTNNGLGSEAIASVCSKNPQVLEIVKCASIEAMFHRIFDGANKKK